MFEFLYVICSGILATVAELLCRNFGIPVPVVLMTVICLTLILNYPWGFFASLLFGFSLDLLQGNAMPFSFPLMALTAIPFYVFRRKPPFNHSTLLILPGFLLPFIMSLPHCAAIIYDSIFFSSLILTGIVCMLLLPSCYSIHGILLHHLKLGIFTQVSTKEDA